MPGRPAAEDRGMSVARSTAPHASGELPFHRWARTVENRRPRVYGKLGIPGRHHLGDARARPAHPVTLDRRNR
jgi:hypothetical protein